MEGNAGTGPGASAGAKAVAGAGTGPGAGAGAKGSSAGAAFAAGRGLSTPIYLGILVAAQAIVAFAAWAAGGAECAMAAGTAGLCAVAWALACSNLRARETRQLAAEIDEVLHGGRRIAFSDYREGDMAVLRNELQKLVDALRETGQRLEREKSALADALADVSHQIRTPLTAMSLTISLAEHAGDPSERMRHLRKLEGMVDRIGWLVTALLKLAKVDAGAFRTAHDEVRAEDVAADALAPLEAALDLRGITCDVSVSEDALFTGDRAWTAEAVENIMKNCMEHTPAGGRITIEARQAPTGCRITVSDTGCGIAESDLPHIFERFYRGRASTEGIGGDAGLGVGAGSGGGMRAPQGFGIGLSLAHALIAAQGGSLRAKNAKEGGAVFEIAFPTMIV